MYLQIMRITQILDTIQGCYLHQHVFQPTRYIDGDDPGILDLILSNEWYIISLITQDWEIAITHALNLI